MDSLTRTPTRSGRYEARTWIPPIWPVWPAKASTPSTEDSRARCAARALKLWWTNNKTMLQVHGQLPDVMGAEFEAAITKLTDQTKPGPRVRSWDSFEHRAADALLALCDRPG